MLAGGNGQSECKSSQFAGWSLAVQSSSVPRLLKEGGKEGRKEGRKEGCWMDVYTLLPETFHGSRIFRGELKNSQFFPSSRPKIIGPLFHLFLEEKKKRAPPLDHQMPLPVCMCVCMYARLTYFSGARAGPQRNKLLPGP